MERLLYSDLLAWKAKKDRKPLILKGARQVGKTYLLKLFGKQAFPNCHYINFEKDKTLHAIFQHDFDIQRILNELGLHFKKEMNLASDLLILDEIQACPAAITSLKYFSEDRPELAVCAAGSLLGLELAPASYPVGKVEFLHLTPLTFAEFLKACGKEKELFFIENFDPQAPFSETTHAHLWNLLKNYFIVGGMPEVINTFLDQQQKADHATYQKIRDKQENLITTYLADMAKHAGKQNAMHIERFWKSIPEQLAQEDDGAHSRFRFKDAIPGIRAFSRLTGVIDWLEKADLIIKVKIAQRAELPLLAATKANRFKLYLFDVGLLGALSGLAPETLYQATFGTYKGFIAENFVAQECVALGFRSLYSWQENTSEVEFLLEKAGQFLPLEVKAGKKTRSKSLSIFCQKYSPPLAFLLNAQPPAVPQKGMIQNEPLYLVTQLVSK